MALLCLLPGCAQPAPPLVAFALPQDSTVAAGEQARWTSGIQLRGDLFATVEAGGQLTIEDATVAPAGPPGSLTIRVEGGGELRVIASSLSAVRIQLQPGASAWIGQSSLDQAAGGIRSTGSTLWMEETVLSGSSEWALRVEGGSARLRDVVVAGSGGQLPAVDASNATLAADALRIDGSASYGLRLSGSHAWLNGSRVGDIADYALQARASTLHLRGNTWSAFCGLFLEAGTHADSEGDRFLDAHRAVTLSRSSLRLANASFAAAPAVLRAAFSDLTLSRASFAGGQATLESSTVRLDGSDLGGTAFEVKGGAVRLRNNTWAPGPSLRNAGNASVDAAWNWWGSASGPSPGQVEGDVRVEPWLDAPPRRR